MSIKKLLLSLPVLLSSQSYADDASWLSKSWGVALQVRGGYLNAGANDYSVIAQQIVDELPSCGHVLVPLTNMAKGFLFTLKYNPNVVLNTIHPDISPSYDEQDDVLEAIRTLKRNGKKVIFYVATDGFSENRLLRSFADPADAMEFRNAWLDYCAREWSNDETAAYFNLIEGFASNYKGLVDGYWLDHAQQTNYSAELVEMLKAVDPGVAVAVNSAKNYVLDNAGDRLLVASDGVLDDDLREYNIVTYNTTEALSDFSGGHPSPIQRGAPPNSWAYEEFSITDIESNPYSSFDGVKQTLKHAFMPMRQQWSVQSSELIYNDIEQLYRVTRRITDAGGGVTFASNYISDSLSPDELSILKEVDARMSQPVKPPYVPYRRPIGAYLTIEDVESTDIGSPATRGLSYDKDNNGAIHVISRSSGVRDHQDQGHFTTGKFLGSSGSITASVQSVACLQKQARAGIMVRENTEEDSTFVLLAQRPDKRISITYRSVTGGDISRTPWITGGTTENKHLKITRNGDLFTAYYSKSGVDGTWVQMGESIAISMNDVSPAGLFASSQDDSKTVISVLKNLMVSDTGISYGAIGFDAESHQNDDSQILKLSNYVGKIYNDNWIRYNSFNFGSGASSININASSLNGGGNVEVRKDSANGILITSIEVDETGGWLNFEDFYSGFNTTISGVHDLYFVFKGEENNALMTLKSFRVE